MEWNMLKRKINVHLIIDKKPGSVKPGVSLIKEMRDIKYFGLVSIFMSQQ